MSPALPNKPVRFRSPTRRIAIHQDAELVDGNGRAVRVLVVDISTEGFRLTADAPLEPGTTLTLRVPRREDVPVEIRWCRGREAGGVFLEDVPEFD